jgi:hypothetical protein
LKELRWAPTKKQHLAIAWGIYSGSETVTLKAQEWLGLEKATEPWILLDSENAMEPEMAPLMPTGSYLCLVVESPVLKVTQKEKAPLMPTGSYLCLVVESPVLKVTWKETAPLTPTGSYLCLVDRRRKVQENASESMTVLDLSSAGC